LLVQSEQIRNRYVYLSWLARCCASGPGASPPRWPGPLTGDPYLQTDRGPARGVVGVADIMNRKPRLAWELYLKMETSADSYHLLQLIANDCYQARAGAWRKAPDAALTLACRPWLRWEPSTTRPRPLMCWSGWTRTPATGLGNAVRPSCPQRAMGCIGPVGSYARCGLRGRRVCWGVSADYCGPRTQGVVARDCGPPGQLKQPSGATAAPWVLSFHCGFHRCGASAGGRHFSGDEELGQGEPCSSNVNALGQRRCKNQIHTCPSSTQARKEGGGPCRHNTNPTNPK
jgi:hypothetical protein